VKHMFAFVQFNQTSVETWVVVITETALCLSEGNLIVPIFGLA
jgi:hypothetical protein